MNKRVSELVRHLEIDMLPMSVWRFGLVFATVHLHEIVCDPGHFIYIWYRCAYTDTAITFYHGYALTQPYLSTVGSLLSASISAVPTLML